MAALGGEWALPLPWSAYERSRAAHLPVSDRLALASRAFATQSERPHPLGPNAAADQPLAPCCSRLSSLSLAPHGRYHLRQEPDAGNPLVRIRGGGHGLTMIPTPTVDCGCDFGAHNLPNCSSALASPSSISSQVG